MELAARLHHCNDNQLTLNVHLENSAALQDMSCIFWNANPLLMLSLGLRLSLFLVFQNLLDSRVKADHCLIISVQFFRLVPGRQSNPLAKRTHPRDNESTDLLGVTQARFC